MKVKKILALVALCIDAFFVGGFSGSAYTQLHRLPEIGRQEGYNQAYIEMKYGMGLTDISEKQYFNYLDAKENYEENKYSKNFRKLVEATE